MRVMVASKGGIDSGIESIMVHTARVVLRVMMVRDVLQVVVRAVLRVMVVGEVLMVVAIESNGGIESNEVIMVREVSRVINGKVWKWAKKLLPHCSWPARVAIPVAYSLLHTAKYSPAP